MADDKRVVIEQTAKQWKALMVFGGTILLLGVFLLFKEEIAMGQVALVVGGLLYFFARFMAWWNHG